MSSESSDGLPPHESYIMPGKMKIGNVSVPAINTMHHNFATAMSHHHQNTSSPKNALLASSRSESIRSSSAGNSDSFSFLHRGLKLAEAAGYFGSEADSERESISPPRLLQQLDEVGPFKLAFSIGAVYFYVFNWIVYSCVVNSISLHLRFQ